MPEFGEECRRLTDLITYSGKDLSVKGLALFTISNAEATNLDVGEEDLTGQGKGEEAEQNNILAAG